MSNAKKEMYEFISKYVTKSDFYAANIIGKVSAFICKRRNELGMTQKEFAKYMKVTQGMVSKWESAEYNFTVEGISKISEKLGYVIDLTFEDESEYLAKDRKNEYNLPNNQNRFNIPNIVDKNLSVA